jgi:hypothetical protein
MLISIHIPKTAGTSWRLIVEANAGRHASFASVELRDRDETATLALKLLDASRENEALTLIQQAGCQLIHGHRADAFLKIFPDSPVIVWLRDPLQRLLSEYMHLKAFKRTEGNRQRAIHAGKVSLKAFARGRGGIYSRLQAQLDQHPGGYIAMLTDRSAQAMQALHDELGWRGRLPRRNVAPRASAEPVHGLVNGSADALERLIASDRRIYDDWARRWDSGEALDIAHEVLRAGPRRQPPPPHQHLRRLAGIGKETMGHFLGRDWR